MSIPSVQFGVGVNDAQERLSDFNRQKLQQAAEAINTDNLLGSNASVVIVPDSRTHRIIVQIVDRTSGQVIDEIPQASLFKLLLSQRRKA